MGCPLSKFQTSLSDFLCVESDPSRCADFVAKQLSVLLKSPEFLEDSFRATCDEGPKSHLMYVAPEGRYSMVAFVWQPGQQTCVHDHVCWCVVGVLEGQEQEASFHLMEDASGKRWLEPVKKRQIYPGNVCALVPPCEDIHQVSNTGTETAISIHVYGTDIGKCGTSINRTFDDLPVVTGQAGTQVNWRDMDIGTETGINLR